MPYPWDIDPIDERIKALEARVKQLEDDLSAHRGEDTMSRLDDLKRSYGDTPELPLTEEQQAQKADWTSLGALAQEYPDLASQVEFHRYLVDPAKWLRDHTQG